MSKEKKKSQIHQMIQDNDWNNKMYWLCESADALFSAPHTVFWGGEHAVISGSPSVVMHITPRVFASVRKSSNGRNTFSWLPAKFGDHTGWKEEWGKEREIEEIVNVLYRSLGFRNPVDLRVYSEGVPSGGCNASGALCCVLSACLLWANELISETDINSLYKLSPSKLSHAFNERHYLKIQDLQESDRIEILTETNLEEADKLAAIMFVAFCLEALQFHAGKASGYGAFVPMVHSQFPFGFCPQLRSPSPEVVFVPWGDKKIKRKGCGQYDLRCNPGRYETEKQIEELKDENPDEIFIRVAKNIANLKLAGWSIAEEVEQTPDFCFGVVYSGVKKNTGKQINQTTEMPENRSKALSTFKEFTNKVQYIMSPELQGFRMLLTDKLGSKEIQADPRQWELTGITIELHEVLRKYFENNGELKNIARAMRRIEGALKSWGLSWFEGEIVSSAIYNAVLQKETDEERIKEKYDQTAVKMTGGGGGGCYIWLAPRDSLDDIISGMENLKSKLPELEVVDSLPNGFSEGIGLISENELKTKHFHSTKSSIKPAKPQRIRRIHSGDITLDVPELIGDDPKIKKIKELIDVVAPQKINLLILGETGTGKEVLARTIHAKSDRSNSNFITIDCSAIHDNLIESEMFGYAKGAFTGATKDREGKMEAANNGTLFLDEIGDMSEKMQSKLLRAIRESVVSIVGSNRQVKVNVRIISATNRDLNMLMESGKFRKDLYYRLDEFNPIELPPLRDRGDDVLLLANHFLPSYVEEFSKHFKSFSKKCERILMNYKWPGNVAELKSAIRKTVLCHPESDYIEEIIPPLPESKDGGIVKKVQLLSENLIYENATLLTDKNFIKMLCTAQDRVVWIAVRGLSKGGQETVRPSQILKWLKRMPEEDSLSQELLVEAERITNLMVPRKSISQSLNKLCRVGKLVCIKKGVYKIL